MTGGKRRELELRVIHAIVDLAEHMGSGGFALPVLDSGEPTLYVCCGSADDVTQLLRQQVTILADAPIAPANDARA